MTAANEKPDCPCCGEREDIHGPLELRDRHYCHACDCEWYPSKRRAQPAETVDEDKERKAFKRWYDFQSAVQHSPQADWAAEKAWLARARGGMDESEAVTLLREVYDHGENFELHERIRVFLGIKD